MQDKQDQMEELPEERKQIQSVAVKNILQLEATSDISQNAGNDADD